MNVEANRIEIENVKCEDLCEGDIIEILDS